MRENCTQGSARGRSGNWPFYLVVVMKINKHFLMVIGGIVVLLLLLFLQFSSLVQVTNWGKHYWQNKSWPEILSDSSSYTKASIVFFGLYGIAIIIGVAIIYKKRKLKKYSNKRKNSSIKN